MVVVVLQLCGMALICRSTFRESCRRRLKTVVIDQPKSHYDYILSERRRRVEHEEVLEVGRPRG